jgi:hypothetical protein
MEKITKTSVTLSVMRANALLPMADVVDLILEAQHAAGFFSVTKPLCVGAYRWAVRTGAAEGFVPKATKVAKAPKATKTKVAKTKATKAPKVTKAPVVAKPVADKPLGTDEIREANLARIKAVHARMKGEGRFDFVDQEVRPEEAPVMDNFDDVDSFASPAFLTRDEVDYLV